MILIINNTHSQRVLQFFPKLLNYFNVRNIEYKIIKGNNEGLTMIKAIPIHQIQAIILSGSPLMFPEMTQKDIYNYITNIYCIKKLNHKIPILGICFGCQLINKIYNGTLVKISQEKVLCKTLQINDNLRAKFCSKYIIDKVDEKYIDVVMSIKIKDKTYPCFIKHKNKPLWGFMFHPEALKHTHYLLDSFLKYSVLYKKK